MKHIPIITYKENSEFYNYNVLLTVHHDISVQYEQTRYTIYFQFI